jgi:hypothetical protein
MSTISAERTTAASTPVRDRLAQARGYDVLDTPPDGAFDQAAALAARLFDAPMATVTVTDEDRIWLKTRQGLSEEVCGIGRYPSLCTSAILQDEPYALPDMLREPRALDDPLVRGQLGIRFHATAPITTAGGHCLGTVTVLDTKPHEATQDDVAALRTLAGLVAEQLELRLAALDTMSHQKANLRAALESRATIDHAVGMIMMARRCDADTAWELLSQTSQTANIKVRVLAETMAELWAGTDPVALDQAACRAALAALAQEDGTAARRPTRA